MDRAKKVTGLWGALPIFRMVAETESVSETARLVGKTPSAVSRTLASLEQGLGKRLFIRNGRSLELNEAGKHLLRGTRGAMRLVDESLAAMKGRLVGSLRITSQEPFTSLFLPDLLDEVRRDHPALVPTLTMVTSDLVAARLLDGSVDVAFVRYPPVKGPLVVSTIASFSTGVYGKRDHTASATQKSDPRALRGSSFVEVEAPKGASQSPWPADWPRTVGLVVPDYDVAMAYVERFGMLAVLPCDLAETRKTRLTRLALEGTSPVRIHAIRREPVDGPGSADLIVGIATQQRARSPGREQRRPGPTA